MRKVTKINDQFYNLLIVCKNFFVSFPKCDLNDLFNAQSIQINNVRLNIFATSYGTHRQTIEWGMTTNMRNILTHSANTITANRVSITDLCFNGSFTYSNLFI